MTLTNHSRGRAASRAALRCVAVLCAVHVAAAGDEGAAPASAPAVVPKPVNFWQLKPENLISSLDRDGDGGLTLGEAFSSGTDKAAAGEALPVPAYERHRVLFHDMDLNGDGSIDADELESPGNGTRLLSAIMAEFWRRTTARKTFGEKDTDAGGSVSESELLAGVAAESAEKLRGECRLCDSDSDGQLTFDEYITLPSVADTSRRGPVPDPVRDEFDRTLTLTREIRSPRSPRAIIAKLSDVAGLTQTVVRTWDLIPDGDLSDSELRFGLERFWGIREAGGLLIRSEQGLVLQLRTFRDRDINRDGRLSLSEFSEKHWAGQQRATLLFAQGDEDKDGSLSLAEAQHTGSQWTDTLTMFAGLDLDRDGRLSRGDVAGVTEEWKRKSLATLFPGFDRDQDGNISYAEFRIAPLANPTANWIDMPTDRDHSGDLTLAEFHPLPTSDAIGLSGLCFAGFDRDRNGRLSYVERGFQFDPDRAASHVVFAARDANADGSVTMTELIDAKKPPADPAARRWFESRLMLVEDAFVEADGDGDGQLTLSEFTAPEAYVAGAMAGRQKPKSIALAQAARLPGLANWRMISLIGANVLLVIGIGWYFLRSAPKQS